MTCIRNIIFTIFFFFIYFVLEYPPTSSAVCFRALGTSLNVRNTAVSLRAGSQNMRNPCSARLIGSSLLSDFHTPITRNPQTTWAEAEPVNLRRFAVGSVWRVVLEKLCAAVPAAAGRELLPRPPPPRHHFTDGPTEQRARLTHFIHSNPTDSYTRCLILSAHLSPSLRSAHVCKHLAEFLTWHYRWNLSQISWIYFIHPKSP